MRSAAAGRRRLASLAAVLTAAIALLGTAGVASAAGPPRLSVRAAILVAPGTSQRLYADNAYRELPIASTTKLMTALIVLEHVHHLGTVFTQPDFYPAAADSQIGIVPGERMTVHDLLVALMLPSADDAAVDLAYNVGHTPGRSLDSSIARFVAMMNTRARKLGLTETHYSTPSGLDTPGNYSSASDLVKLAGYDVDHHHFLRRIVDLTHATLRSGNAVRYVVNRNTLVARYPWITGVKTGHTLAAGYVLVASGHRNGMTLISAVLGTSSEASRDGNTLALLSYGFANFTPVHPVRAGQVFARPTILDQGGHADLVAAHGFARIEPRAAHLRVLVQASKQLTGPLRRHAQAGSLVVMVDGRAAARIPLLLAAALPAASPLVVAANFFTSPLMLVLIALLVVGILLAVAFFRRQRRRLRSAKGGLEPA